MSYLKKNWGTFVLVFVSITLFACQAVFAQFGRVPHLPKMQGEYKMPEVGTFVEYKLTHPDMEKEGTFKLAVVGKEKDLYWVEMEIYDKEAKSNMIQKILVSGNPQDDKYIKRTIIQVGDKKPMELPDIFTKTGPLQKEEEEVKKKADKLKTEPEEFETKDLGTEKLKTAMGVFKCEHKQFKSKDKKTTSDVWLSSEIPFYGLAKQVSEGTVIEIIKHGKGAKSAITEEPEKLELPGLTPTTPKEKKKK